MSGTGGVTAMHGSRRAQLYGAQQSNVRTVSTFEADGSTASCGKTARNGQEPDGLMAI